MSESQAAAARNALAEVFDAGKAAAAGGPAVRETGTQAAEARAALLKAFHASEQAAARPAASDAGGVQAAAARAALQEAFARSSSLRSSSEDQQVQGYPGQTVSMPCWCGTFSLLLVHLTCPA